MNLNATNIIDFISCQKKFYYRETIKDDSLLIKTDDLIFGKYFHQIIEEYLIKWKTRKQAIVLYSKYFNNKDKFLLQLDLFLEKFAPLLSTKDSVEVPFVIETDYSDIKITGRFDRILADGTIIDWKTGNVKYDLNFNIQAILYSQAYKNIYNKPPRNVLFCSLKTGKIVSYKQGNNSNTIENILFNVIIPGIANTKNHMPTGLFNDSCKFCMYKNICHKELGIYEREDKGSSEELFAN